MKTLETRLIAAMVVCFAFVSRLPAENLLESEFRAEGDDISKNCFHPSSLSFASVIGCPQVLFTGSPLHIAVGSLAPQNGFGAGLALTLHKTPNENWRLFWDFDAIATPNGSWRAGGYMTAVLVRHQNIVVLPGNGRRNIKKPAVQPMPAFHAYAQSISLNNVAYFGLGQNTPKTAESWFGMRETIVGANVAVPVYAPLNLILTGEANGRFTAIRADDGEPNPSIEQLYTNATAPGLVSQPGYAQFGEGVRLSPVATARVQFNYSAALQEWISGTSGASFRRFSVDLEHVFPLYNGMRSLAPREFNGPDDCSSDPGTRTCPPDSRNLEGSFSLSFFYASSYTSGANAVPFYLDPTLGGSDIDGSVMLPSYADYRFRGPDLMLLRGSFEHSLYKWPVGVKFMVDEGRVGLTPGDIGFHHLAHSYAAGITLHAGGLPIVDIMFAWGGNEGTHTVANVGTSLLGGGARPSLY